MVNLQSHLWRCKSERFTTKRLKGPLIGTPQNETIEEKKMTGYEVFKPRSNEMSAIS